METRNPYDAPKAASIERPVAYGEIRIFSASGRLGRLRYIGYSIGLTLLMGGVMGALGALLGHPSGLMIVAYLAIMVVSVLLTIQRAHDFDASGWLALVMIIPLVNLIFWFVPGTKGENRFGLQPPPNTTGVVVLALILPIVFVVGTVAAIAIPAYQDYVKRAAATQNR